MKWSLRVKLFSLVSGLILFFILLSWLLNTLFLDKYYLYEKKKNLTESYKQINSLYKGDPEAIALNLERIENTKGLHIIIYNKDEGVIYNSRGRLKDLKQIRPGKNGMANIRNAPEVMLESLRSSLAPNQKVIERGRDFRLNTSFLQFFSLLNNGDLLYLSITVEVIQESVKIANKFYLFTGMLTIIIGTLLVFFITGRFTKPILELNAITKRMAVLDFSRRYPVKNNDEIGQLGVSINSLSEQLQSSILGLREANQKLKEDIEQERKIDEMRKEFISNVSHELKTPIALIQGYAEGLKLNIIDNEEDKNMYCDIITDEALKMNKLVKQLLDLSQIEAGYIQLDKTIFDIGELIDQVLKKNALVIKEKNIQLTNDCREKMLVNADYDRAEQVLVNYISNAVNHLDERKIIQINVEKLKDKARTYVFNSGKHIPEESIDKIWSSFYKVDKARTRAYGGTGLGLSIVRAVQEAQKNSYGVRNVEDGVEFWFDLDLS